MKNGISLDFISFTPILPNFDSLCLIFALLLVADNFALIFFAADIPLLSSFIETATSFPFVAQRIFFNFNCSDANIWPDLSSFLVDPNFVAYFHSVKSATCLSYHFE